MACFGASVLFGRKRDEHALKCVLDGLVVYHAPDFLYHNDRDGVLSASFGPQGILNRNAVWNVLVVFCRVSFDVALWIDIGVYRRRNRKTDNRVYLVHHVFGFRFCNFKNRTSKGASMMQWIDIAKKSFTEPREAARALIDQNFGWDVIWSAFIAASCLSTILFFSFDGGEMPSEIPFAKVFETPVLLVGFFVGSGVLLSVSINFVSKMIGGQGNLLSMMLIMAWFQVLQVAIQIVTYILLILIAPAALLLQFALFWYGIYIFVAFVAQAYGFDAWLKAAMASLVGFIGSIMALAVVLSLVLGGLT